VPKSPPILLRQMREPDESFVFNSWLRSYRKGVPTAPSNIYYFGQHKVISDILKRSLVMLAIDPEDHEHIYGWVCYEPRELMTGLHYVYVKHAFRRLGIASTLIDYVKKQCMDSGSDVCYTSRTWAGTQLARKRALIFNDRFNSK
jgi:hypothetical protein